MDLIKDCKWDVDKLAILNIDHTFENIDSIYIIRGNMLYIFNTKKYSFRHHEDIFKIAAADFKLSLHFTGFEGFTESDYTQHNLVGRGCATCSLTIQSFKILNYLQILVCNDCWVNTKRKPYHTHINKNKSFFTNGTSRYHIDCVKSTDTDLFYFYEGNFCIKKELYFDIINSAYLLISTQNELLQRPGHEICRLCNINNHNEKFLVCDKCYHFALSYLYSNTWIKITYFNSFNDDIDDNNVKLVSDVVYMISHKFLNLILNDYIY
jgi:hypothetical protein